MHNQPFYNQIQATLADIDAQGLTKHEVSITSEQSAHIQTAVEPQRQSVEMLNLCANNYLGLANEPRLIASAKKALDENGYGMASVRFICGTSSLHHALETRLANFLQQDACILYSSCFDANTGLFETLLGEPDAIISDSLNHASIIDGIRLCKAKRYRYQNNDMQDLETQLAAAKFAHARHIMIATDGVFSMDGTIANLPVICDLAAAYGALVMVDDSHAVGVLGAQGRGSIEHCDVMNRVDIVTGTLGKALGGASGGYVAASASVVELLRQRSRPYLFSNALAPMITAASLTALDIVEAEPQRRQALQRNAEQFSSALTQAGFDLAGEGHPIIPIMVGDANRAQAFSQALASQGILASAFAYPVVPAGKARIRTQMSSAFDENTLAQAIAGVIAAGKSAGIIA